MLRTSGTVHSGRTLLYRASKLDCDVCPFKAKCCPKEPARKVPRDLHEDARDVARRKMDTKAFLKSRDQRKRVEMRFAHLKTHHGFERMRLRGLSGARDEFHLAAIVQNLKTLALRLIRPPPLQRAYACVCVSVVQVALVASASRPKPASGEAQPQSAPRSCWLKTSAERRRSYLALFRQYRPLADQAYFDLLSVYAVRRASVANARWGNLIRVNPYFFHSADMASMSTKGGEPSICVPALA